MERATIVQFASSPTAMIEFMPRGRFAPVFWEQSRLLDLQYHGYAIDRLDTSHTMALDEGSITWIDSILDSQNSPQPKGLEPFYEWHV